MINSPRLCRSISMTKRSRFKFSCFSRKQKQQPVRWMFGLLNSLFWIECWLAIIAISGRVEGSLAVHTSLEWSWSEVALKKVVLVPNVSWLQSIGLTLALWNKTIALEPASNANVNVNANSDQVPTEVRKNTPSLINCSERGTIGIQYLCNNKILGFVGFGKLKYICVVEVFVPVAVIHQ
jgi:hypothetical protein